MDDRIAALEARISQLEGRRRRRVPRRRIALALGLLLAAVPAIAVAVHDFTDVPTASTFHTNIHNIAQAGITAGCNPPTQTKYCPTDSVRRDQMAAFLNRGLGRSTGTWDSGTIGGGNAIVLSDTIRTPGAGFIVASGQLTAASATGCPCELNMYLNLAEDDEPGSILVSNTSQIGTPVSASNTWRFRVPAAGTYTIEVRGYGHVMDVTGAVQAVWVPFDWDGSAYEPFVIGSTGEGADPDGPLVP